MFKYCFNSTTLRNQGVFEALANIKAYGYEGVELTLNDSHVHPLKSDHQLVSTVKRFCEDNNITIACVAAGGDRLLSDEPYEPSLVCPDQNGRRRRLDLIKKSIEVASFLEAPVLNINSGKLREGVGRAQGCEYLRDGLDELLLASGDLTIVIEPEPDFLIGTSREGVDLVRAIDDPHFKLNLDIGHVFCSEVDCYSAIANALPYARHIHIEDIRDGIHHHEIPGEGDIDFHGVVEMLKQHSYNEYVSVELHHHADVWERALGESLRYLTSLGGR
jgi:hydroxypyruvate isomerase